MMIRSLDVDCAHEATLPLGDVIRNVWDEVRVRSVALAHHAILVISIIGRAQPQRAVTLVSRTVRNEPIDGLGHLSISVQARLEIVRVELDAERLEIQILLGAQLANRELAHAGLAVVTRRDLADVLAVIAAFRDRDGATRGVDVRLHAALEVLDLDAGIVVVELARHAPPGALEQRRYGIAERRLAAVTYVQWPGRVCGHELDDDRLAAPPIGAAVARVRCHDVAHGLCDGRREPAGSS